MEILRLPRHGQLHPQLCGGRGIHVQGMGFKVSAVAQDSVVVQIVKGLNYHTHANSASKIWTGFPFSFT